MAYLTTTNMPQIHVHKAYLPVLDSEVPQGINKIEYFRARLMESDKRVPGGAELKLKRYEARQLTRVIARWWTVEY